MIINSVESYCNSENDGMTRIGNVNGLDGVRSEAFFLDINSSFNNTSQQNNRALSRHPEETSSGECRNAFSNFNQGRNSLQPQDQFTGCYERQRHYSDFGNETTNNSTYGCLNQQQSSPVISASSVSQSLSSNSLPSSPAVTIISVPSPVELKPNVTELERFHRQNQLQQGTIMSTPPHSSSPEMDEVISYFQASPSAQSYQQQQTNEQLGNLQHGGNCYDKQLSTINFPSTQQCISSIAESQTSLTDLNSYQYNCTTSGATSPTYIPSEANTAAQFQSSNYPGYITQSQDSLPLSETSLLPYSVGFAVSVENQQTNLCNDGVGNQSLANYDSANYNPALFQSNNTSQSVTSKQKLHTTRRGGKRLEVTSKASEHLRDEQLIDMSVRDLNRWLRGLRYVLFTQLTYLVILHLTIISYI